MPIYEPGLDDLVAANARAGRPDLQHRARRARSPTADAVFIAVGTPSRRGDGHADLSFVYDAAREIARALDGSRSSSPNRPCRSAPATRSSASSARRGPMPTVAVVSNPEFLREGAAIQDFKHPDRIVIGTDDARAREVMARTLPPALSQPLADSVHRPATAELIKYAANGFLATKITFINEIADLCRDGRRRRAGGRARHRARQPHRLEIPARRPRLRRLRFPKDTVALLKTAPITTRRCASSRRWSR